MPRVLTSSWMAFLVALAVAGGAQARPLDLTMEGRVGPYVPDTDPHSGDNALDTSASRGAFACAYGATLRPSFWFSPQVTVFDLFGTLTAGPELGFYTVGARTFTASGGCSDHNGLTTNSLTVIPVLMDLTYRFDWPLEKFGFPLVPYARVGLGGAGFINTKDDKIPTSNVDSTGRRLDPVGFSLGGKAGAGLMLALDFLEPLRALRARAKGVYKHSYVFAEVSGFDAGMYQNAVFGWGPELVRGWPKQKYVGTTLVVGTERLPLVTGGLSVSF